MGLRDIGESLPPGFRFYPSDEELVCHYLFKKIANEEVLRGTLVEIDLHICEPWQLPDVAKLNSNEWYFFSFRDRKYATGFRTNRATTTGYWKATGKDRAVLDPKTRAIVGMRKTLVFYKNRAPNGIKTGWIMHEFRLENPHSPPKEDWVLCRVFHKSRGDLNHHKLNSPHTLLYDSTCNNELCHQNIIPSLSHNLCQHHQQGQNPNTSLGLSSIEVGPTTLLSHETNEKPLVSGQLLSNPSYLQNKVLDQSTTKCHEDEYGFLFDIDCPDDEVCGILDDHMKFDHDNGGSVFV